MSRHLRTAVLQSLGATAPEVEELLAYNGNSFAAPDRRAASLPLPDEPFVAAWADYAEEARHRGAVPVLRRRLRQLCFPVAAGISQTPDYIAATRHGAAPVGTCVLPFEAPDRVRLFLHSTPAGRIPVLQLEHRPDFVAVVRAVTQRNEPVDIPQAQGALMVAGYNNWDRIDRLRTLFERGELDADGARGWADVFRAVREQKQLYQDCFILLTSGPYSAIDAADLGMTAGEWNRLSGLIRLEHECAHYFTRRVLGSLGKGVLPELIADYAGVSTAVGRFRADWFLRFLGLEEPGRYRAGGRLERYRGDLSDGAFRILQELTRRAARNVETAERTVLSGPGAVHSSMAHRTRMILALAACTLEDLARESVSLRLRRSL